MKNDADRGFLQTILKALGENMEESNNNELFIDARIDNIPTVTAFVDEKLEALDFPLKAQMQIDVAIDELFSNIAKYGYRENGGPAIIRFEEIEEPHSVVVTFIDEAPRYNPLEKEDPDVGLSAEEREIGGLGIFLVKKTMDEMVYDYIDGKNVLKIRKEF